MWFNTGAARVGKGRDRGRPVGKADSGQGTVGKTQAHSSGRLAETGRG